MIIISIILIVLGLCLFEIISSVDNAIINAQVLSTMRKRSRRWFLIWGMLFAVFVVRGLLPWIIVWASMPSLGPIKAFTATFSNNPQIIQIMESSSPVLLMGGGVFLFFLFLNWFLLERKNSNFEDKSFFSRKKFLFFALALIILIIVIALTIKINPKIPLAALIGAAVFFITYGLRKNAERTSKDLMKKNISDISKIIYLEILDASFSIDGVLGAFAFTLSVPLIILGNGLGAFVVRQFTVGNIQRIKKYIYLKHGAMYSICFLGIIMIMHSLGFDAPFWLSPLVTFSIVGYFFWKSKRYINEQELKSKSRKE